jgi:hypothetical protein
VNQFAAAEWPESAIRLFEITGGSVEQFLLPEVARTVVV